MIKIDKEITEIKIKINELEKKIKLMEYEKQILISILEKIRDKLKQLEKVLGDEFYMEVFKND